MNSPPSSLLVTTSTTASLSVDDRRAWVDLHLGQSGLVNPFLHPIWIEEWSRQFVPTGDEAVFIVRRSSDGTVVGIAPMYRQSVRAGGLRLARRWIPFGAGTAPNPLEMPGFLAAPGANRDVARALVTHLLGRRDADWAEIDLGPDQGWFEPEWVFSTASAPVAFGDHQRPWACVVLPVLQTWAATRSTFKRNLKESIRRSENRLPRILPGASVHHRIGDDVDDDALRRFFDLHRQRSSNDRATVSHPDAYSDPRSRALVRAAVPRLAAEGQASLFELVVEGRVLASQLALHAGATSYVHSSGFHSDAWEVGPVTLLQTALVRHAVDRGDELVNFSPGPSVSKLRWSEKLAVGNEFAFGCGSRSLGVRFGAFQAVRSLRRTASSLSYMKRQSGPASPAGPGVGRPSTGSGVPDDSSTRPADLVRTASAL